MLTMKHAKFAATVLAFALLAALVGASGASASTTLGIKFQNPGDESYPGTLIQTESPKTEYAAPTDGVITSWSKFSSSNPNELQQLKLKVGREVAKNSWQVVGESNLETLTKLAARNTFATRISVKKGDSIGLYSANNGPVRVHELIDPFYAYGSLFKDVLVSEPLEVVGFYVVAVDAQLEPDADNDGFGDETQDKCPGAAGPTDGCVPTVITPPPPAQEVPKTVKTLKCKKGQKKVKVKGKSKCKKKRKKHKTKGHK